MGYLGGYRIWKEHLLVVVYQKVIFDVQSEGHDSEFVIWTKGKEVVLDEEYHWGLCLIVESQTFLGQQVSDEKDYLRPIYSIDLFTGGLTGSKFMIKVLEDGDSETL